MLNNFSAIYEITFLVLFMGCTVALSLALLLIQMELVHVNSAVTFPFKCSMDNCYELICCFGFVRQTIKLIR